MSETKARTAKKQPAAQFTPEEKAAAREYVRELKAAATRELGESDTLAKIAEMPPSDRKMAEKIHAIVKSVVPEIAPRTWYGMPAYALDGNILCFFQAAGKFKARYATLGFTDKAKLDQGNLWPNAYALTKISPGDEATIRALVKQAAGK